MSASIDSPMMWRTYSSEFPMPSGPVDRCAGHATFGSCTITGPGSSRSTHCSTIRSDWRISSTRTWYLAKQSLSVRVGTSKAYAS